jgi:hypothetical protein
MADFCHECTFELFGDELAPFNDMVNTKLANNEMQQVLCEGCGYIDVDNKGRKLHWNGEMNVPNKLCPHGVKWDQCRVVVHKEKKYVAYVSDLNFHGVGEFIARYPEGDMSSEYIKDYIPCCSTWLEIDRMLTP